MMQLETTVTWRNWFNAFLTAIAYAIAFYLLQGFAHHAAIMGTRISNTSLNAWDVAWYRSVADNGYQFTPGVGSNSGFFPLIPWIWKLTHLSTVGMAGLNAVMFAAGFGLLVAMLGIDKREQLLWLSVPTTYFMFVPYTEGYFFLFIMLTLWGIQRRQRSLIWVGLLLAALCRATVIIVLPALLMMELTACPRAQWWRATGQWLLNYVVPVAAGLGFFVWYQHYATGAWFPYFIMQSQQWGHAFSLPAYPLSSLDGPRIFWLSSFAAFVTLTGAVTAFRSGILWLFANRQSSLRWLTLAATYLMLAYCNAVFFNPKWGTNTTNVMGLFRYSMATPFFFIFLHYVIAGKEYRVKHYLLVFLLANLVWMTMGAYTHVQQLIFLNFNTAVIMLYLLWGSKKYGTVAGMLLFGINLFLQLHLFQHFISGLYSD